MDRYGFMAVSENWGSFRTSSGLMFRVDTKQVSS